MMGDGSDDLLRIGSHTFRSRLITGTGKYPDPETMVEATKASGTELVTVAVRRIDLSKDRSEKNFIDYLLPLGVKILPNTAGCYDADCAVRTARLARAALETDLIKLEVIGDQKTLFPDMYETLRAAEILVREGFTVLPYTIPDQVAGKRLEEIGCAAVMPLGSPIGSGQGMPDFRVIEFMVEELSVPVIVDAGLGAPSDASLAMEIGAAAVLVNTGIAKAKDPVKMARAFKLGVEAGRLAYHAGRIPKLRYAMASSPTEGVIGTPAKPSG